MTGIQPGVGPGPTFNYGMNQRINFNLPAPANVPETPFKITQAVNPSAFVVFSEQRVHASETPYYGNNPADLSSTYNWCNRFSGRHSGTGNIVFGDAHVASFRYGYVVGLGRWGDCGSQARTSTGSLTASKAGIQLAGVNYRVRETSGVWANSSQCARTTFTISTSLAKSTGVVRNTLAPNS